MPVNLFDANFYRSAHLDLKDLTDAQALSHLQTYGLNENRSFSPFVDLSFYRASNSDLASFSNQQAYEHLSNYGIKEGRRFSQFCDLNFYRQNNSDLANFNNEQLFEHLQTYGLAEGRQLSPFIDISISGDNAGNALNVARNIALNSHRVIYRESVGDGDRDDYYRVEFSTQTTNFQLGLNGLSSNANVELLNNSGQLLASSTNDGTANEALNLSNLLAGTYYIRVYQGVSSANTNYNLSLSATPVFSAVVTAAAPPAPSNNSFLQQVVALTNVQRQQAGLQPLQLSIKLTNSAQAHSEDMALRDFFSHTGSNGSSVGDRVKVTGYQFSYVGENIAAGYATPEEVVQGWMDSPGHRANILNSKFQEIGIGYYYLANDTGNVNYNHYWTQDLGTVV